MSHSPARQIKFVPDKHVKPSIKAMKRDQTSTENRDPTYEINGLDQLPLTNFIEKLRNDNLKEFFVKILIALNTNLAKASLNLSFDFDCYAHVLG